jgi:hypothetical protein
METNPPTSTDLAVAVEDIITNVRKVTFADQVPNTTNIAIDNLPLSLQERLVIRPSALPTWRQARSNMSAEAKALARASHLDRLATQDLLPSWSLGLDPIPGFLEPHLTSIIQLRKHHAIETMQLAKEQLTLRAQEHRAVGEACLLTCETLYGDDQNAWTQARELLTTLIGGDKTRCISALNKRVEQISANPTKDETISSFLTAGSRNQGRRTQNRPRSRSRSRSRSQSPRRGRRPARQSPNRNPGTSNPQGNNRTNNTKGGPKPKGQYNNQNVLTFSRKNFNGRSKSPNNANPRSLNSLWNEDNDQPSRGKKNNGAPKNARNMKLSKDEETIIMAIRRKNNGD